MGGCENDFGRRRNDLRRSQNRFSHPWSPPTELLENERLCPRRPENRRERAGASGRTVLFEFDLPEGTECGWVGYGEVVIQRGVEFIGVVVRNQRPIFAFPVGV